MESSNKDELFSSLVSNIKNYSGNDPLRPWLQGIRKMKESLPPHILKEKLPRFLQKCAQSFESDRRYRNDSRYVRVWIQLMDYVDDARVVLRKMEKNHIGLKRAMFYSAYALCYEKQKKFEDAENMYCLGARNLAEPADELQKSYEQFLHRMKLLTERKTKKIMLNSGKSSGIPFQEAKTKITDNGILEKGDASQISHYVVKSGDQHQSAERVNSMQECSKEGGDKGSESSLELNTTTNLDEANYKFHPDGFKDGPVSRSPNEFREGKGNSGMHKDKPTRQCGDDTVVVKFVGSAIVGKSEAEDACHHGLVDPTVNMKEAMNAISSMFKEPLEPEPMARRRSHQSKPKENPQSNNVLEVFVDDDLDKEVQPNHLKLKNPNSPKKQTETKSQKPFVGAFKIWTEEDDDSDDDDDDDGENADNCSDGEDMEIKEHMEGPKSVSTGLNSRSDTEMNANSSEDVRLNGDTVIRRFVGSTVFDDPRVENACHHGLVDPTINLKEAMDDINSMFGKPLNFVRAQRPKKQAKPIEHKPAASQGFSILADDDLGEDPMGQASKCMSSKFGEGDLFEQTIFTREAMADINEMFGKSLDF